MTDFVVIPNSPSNSTGVPKSWKLLLLLWIVTNAIIWSAALLTLKETPPTYTSEWKLTLPGARSSTDVNLPGIGQATSFSDSPYSSQSADPRENYKLLAATDEVLEAAAKQLKIPVGRFGKPQIKIVDNTTLMQFAIAGDTPEEAQKKALALHRALQAKIDELRKEEIAQQNRNLEVVLSGAEQKLQASQQRLSKYKAHSHLNSSEQLRDLSVNLEGLRRQRAETLAQLKQASARFKQLSASLGLSARQAVDALALQADPLLQQYLANYSKASLELVDLSTKYSSAHPGVISRQIEKDAARVALLQQAQSLLGRPVSQANLEQLNLGGGGSSGSSSERASLFQQLISLQAEQQGLQAQAQELGQQNVQLESRLTTLSQEEAQLDSLQRDIRIAEAVFSSTLTRLDLSKSNISASYPPISVFEKPSLPEASSAPKSKFLLLGAIAGSFFSTTGMSLLWLCDRKTQKAKR